MPGKTAKKPAKKATKPAPKAAVKAKPAPKPAAKPVVKSVAKPVAKKPAAKAAPAKASPAKPVKKVVPVAKPQGIAKKAAPTMIRRSPSADSSQFSGFTPYKETRGEEYMNPAQVEHFRLILESWKHELMEKVDETVHHMQDEAANFPDPNDRASQESDFTMELRARDRERKLIKKIEESLQRLDDGEFGHCESCGVEIGVRRLEARPTATLCIDCKELDEIRERQSKG